MIGLFTGSHRKKILLLAAALLGLLAHFSGRMDQIALAQSPISARVERTSLAIDEQLVLHVTITGDFLKIPRPDLAQLQDFVVVSSSTSTQVSIVNGKMTSQGVFIYRLQPLREGKLIIAPISVNISGQLYQTDPIEIEVFAAGIAPSNPNAPEAGGSNTLRGQDFFVEAEVDNPTPYLGQQVIYIFRIYQAVNFPPGQPDYTPPAFTDFWSSEILAQPHYNTRVNERDYLVTEILTALFPANLGSITVEPASLVIPGGLLNPDIRLETNPVTIDVRPLPEGAPEDFSGAVGQFDISASLSQFESKINEPLTLVIKVEGTGNIQTLGEPKLPDMPHWRFFESQISTSTETSDGILRGSRTFERLVVPGQPGEQLFPPVVFSYYDPAVEAYQVISTDPIPVTILPDVSVPAPPVASSPAGSDKQTVDLIVSDIRHIKPIPVSLNLANRTSLPERVIYWGCWAFPALLIGVTYIWQRQKRRLREDTAYARFLRAKRVASKILDSARPVGSDDYASVANRALLGYLSDKLNTPTVGLTNDNLINLLRQSELEANLVERIGRLLHQFDIGRFAPISEGDGEAMIVETKTMINILERSFSKRR